MVACVQFFPIIRLKMRHAHTVESESTSSDVKTPGYLVQVQGGEGSWLKYQEIKRLSKNEIIY